IHAVPPSHCRSRCSMLGPRGFSRLTWVKPSMQSPAGLRWRHAIASAAPVHLPEPCRKAAGLHGMTLDRPSLIPGTRQGCRLIQIKNSVFAPVVAAFADANRLCARVRVDRNQTTAAKARLSCARLGSRKGNERDRKQAVVG